MAYRWCRGGDELDEFLVVDLARGQKFTRLPNDGARTGAFATEPAIQHRSTGQHNGRDIDGRRRHQLRRRGFVAAGGKHDAVDKVTVESLYQPEVAKVAVQGGGRALTGFLNRVHRKFERNAAGFANPFAYSMGKLEVVAVTWREVRPRLGDANDGLAGLQLLTLQAEVHVALQIQRRHVGVVRIGAPPARAEL